MKTVLITVAGGAIGMHMIQKVLDDTDWNIVAVDSFRADHKGYFDRLTQFNHNERVRVIVHNLNAPFSEREIRSIGEVNYIINLASRSDVQNSIEDPLPFVRNNTELMLTMLEFARVVKPEVFLHFSTDEVYGSAPKDSKGHPEWDPIVPSNPYSASKACQEALAIAWWRSYGVPLIITNTMNNFGETQAPSKFPAMIQKYVEADKEITVHSSSTGEYGSRYYLHSRNAADAVIFILKNVPVVPHAHGEIDLPVRLNIVGDRQVNNYELVSIIADMMGKYATINEVNFHEHNPGHDLHYGLDGTKLAELGWKAPESFEDSLRRTIEWQQANKEWLL